MYLLSKKLNTTVSIKGVDIEFFSKVVLEGIYIEDLNKDTLLYAERFNLNIEKFDLKNNFLQLESITLKNSLINVSKQKRGGDFNFQFLADAFAGDKKDTTQKSQGLEVLCSDFILVNCNINYSLMYKKHGEWGIDYDYIKAREVNADLHSMHLLSDTLYTYVNNLSLREESGFRLKNGEFFLKAHSHIMHFKNVRMETKDSYVEGDVKFHTEEWEDYDDVYHKPKVDITVKSSDLEMADIAYFAPELRGMHKKAKLKGHATGSIDELTVKNLELWFGDKTYIAGKLKMTGLPNAEETIFDFRIKDLYTNKKDMEGIPLPPFTKGEYLELPDEIAKLGDIHYTGDYTGFYNDFVTYGVFTSALGKANTDIKINYNLDTEISTYKGRLVTENFNIGSLLNQPELGNANFDIEIDGKGFSLNTLNTRSKGHISSIEFRKHQFKNINLDGNFENKQFEGHCDIDNNEIKLAFDGKIDLRKKVPEYLFDTEIEKADLFTTNLYTARGPFTLKGNFNVDLAGNNLDDLLGRVSADGLEITTSKKEYKLGDLLFDARNYNNEKKLIVASEIADARIIGNYNFTDLTINLKKLIHHHYPKLFTETEQIKNYQEETFQFNFRIKDCDPVTEIFLPQLKVKNGGTIDGEIDSRNQELNINLDIGEFEISGVNFKSATSRIKSNSNAITSNNTLNRLTINDSIWFENIALIANPQNEKLNTELSWKNNQKINNSGKLNAAIQFYNNTKLDLLINSGTLSVRDTTWNFDPYGMIAIDSSDIYINNVVLNSTTQKINVSGGISKRPTQALNIDFNKFLIQSINPLLTPWDITLKGEANGTFHIRDVYHNPLFNADIHVKDLYLDNEFLGQGEFSALYLDNEQKINVYGTIQKGRIPTIKIGGVYYPFKRDNDIDFTIALNHAPLKLLEKYTTDILSSFKGTASGDLWIKGYSGKPDLNGRLDLESGSFKADYLNTFYTFNGELNIKPSLFEIPNATVFDERGTPSNVTFKMYHNNFKDFRFDVKIIANNLFCLNTTIKENNLFYGKAYATGIANIYGPSDKITMDISAKSEKGTQLFIPLDEAVEVSENNFIRFTNKDTTKVKNINRKLDLSGVQMNFDLDLTPDAQFQMVFDSKVGDVIKGKGNGNVRMEINTNGKFNMYGNYIFTNGNYLFTFENAINKMFDIVPGSTISWNGDPYNANIDVAANYEVNTNLSTLMQDSTESEFKRNRRIYVQLNLKDKLFNPNISFAINFPSLQNNELLKAKINTIIGNENNQELNRQVFSLLMIGSFLPPSGGTIGSTRIQDGLGNSSAELLSAQFNNWISQLSKGVNFGVNYKPGSTYTPQQVNVAISTQLFQNKLSIDGNFGVANRQQQTAAASSLVDVTVEYKITDNGKLKLIAYNKPNDYINTFTQGYNKQGVGLIYREDFDKFSDLFNKKKKQKTELPPPPPVTPEINTEEKK